MEDNFCEQTHKFINRISVAAYKMTEARKRFFFLARVIKVFD